MDLFLLFTFCVTVNVNHTVENLRSLYLVTEANDNMELLLLLLLNGSVWLWISN